MLVLAKEARQALELEGFAVLQSFLGATALDIVCAVRRAVHQADVKVLVPRSSVRLCKFAGVRALAGDQLYLSTQCSLRAAVGQVSVQFD